MAKYTFQINGEDFQVEGDSVTKLTHAAMRVYSEKSFPQDYNSLYNRILNTFVENKASRPPSTVKPPEVKLNFNLPGRHKLKDYWKGGKALIKNVIGEIVPQAQINKRSAICLQCPLKVSATDCVGCGAAGTAANYANRAKKLIGKEYKIDPRLEMAGCSVCGCTFQLLMPCKTEDLHEDSEDQAKLRQEKAPFCWMIKERETNA